MCYHRYRCHCYNFVADVITVVVIIIIINVVFVVIIIIKIVAVGLIVVTLAPYNDVTSPPSWLFAQPFVQGQIKENIEDSLALRGESPGELRGKCFNSMTSSCFEFTAGISLSLYCFGGSTIIVFINFVNSDRCSIRSVLVGFDVSNRRILNTVKPLI